MESAETGKAQRGCCADVASPGAEWQGSPRWPSSWSPVGARLSGYPCGGHTGTWLQAQHVKSTENNAMKNGLDIEKQKQKSFKNKKYSPLSGTLN